jgi:hypothetical protein
MALMTFPLPRHNVMPLFPCPVQTYTPDFRPCPSPRARFVILSLGIEAMMGRPSSFVGRKESPALSISSFTPPLPEGFIYRQSTVPMCSRELFTGRNTPEDPNSGSSSTSEPPQTKIVPSCLAASSSEPSSSTGSSSSSVIWSRFEASSGFLMIIQLEPSVVGFKSTDEAGNRSSIKRCVQAPAARTKCWQLISLTVPSCVTVTDRIFPLPLSVAADTLACCMISTPSEPH